MCLHILQLSYRRFWQNITSPKSLSPPLQPRFGFMRLLTFPKAKIAVEREQICECDGHTVHILSQRRLTADWLAPRESDCSRMHSKISSVRLPSYIKAMRPVLQIYKMAGYFPDSPRMIVEIRSRGRGWTQLGYRFRPNKQRPGTPRGLYRATESHRSVFGPARGWIGQQEYGTALFGLSKPHVLPLTCVKREWKLRSVQWLSKTPRTHVFRHITHVISPVLEVPF